jgi:hypothetical protein
MKTISNTVRFVAAIAAVAITTGLLGAVVSISEPQGAILLARTQQREAVAAAHATSAHAVAMADTAKTAR